MDYYFIAFQIYHHWPLMTPKGRNPGNLEFRHRISLDRDLIEDRLKEFLTELSIENDSLLNSRSLVDKLDQIISSGIDDSLTREYEIDHDQIEWKEEESKPLSELVLKKDKKDFD